MKIVLINPQRNRKDQLGSFASYVPLNVPFGIGFLAGYLLKKDKNVAVIDEEVIPVSYHVLAEYVKAEKPPYLFGISCLTANIGRGLEISRMIKERWPDSVIIFGGIHPTVLPEELLMSRTVDIVVRNEGELTLLRIYEAIESGRYYTDIQGISYIENSHIVHRDAPPLIDMKELPIFPYFLFEKYRSRYNFGFLNTSRGCPYDCIFCSQRAITGRSYRFMATDKVIETLDIMINKYNRRNIVFSDDNFIVDKKRVIEICSAIVENRLQEKVSFMCQARGDAINDDVLYSLKNANFTGLSFGIETASDRLMDIIKKAETVQDNINGIHLAKRYGFKVSGTFILGLPSETKEERLQAYKLARELNLDYVRFNNATPYPGTELYNIALKECRLNIGKDWSNLNACTALVDGTKRRLPYVPTTCTEEELMADVFWYNIFYTLRPIRILRLLFDKTTDTAGWFTLPEKWYLQWSEWQSLIKLSTGFLLKIFKMAFYSFKYKIIFFKKDKYCIPSKDNS